MKIINGELEIIQKRIQKYKDTIKELNFIKDYIIKNASHIQSESDKYIIIEGLKDKQI